jgi:hypothetical protein
MIISANGANVSEGVFVGFAEIIGETREECLAALAESHQFADDIGESVREDGVTIYRIIGGAIK